MRFVSGSDTLDLVSELLKSEDVEIALAVAFWGDAAMKRLGVADWKAKKIRVICNATSGACNPKALTALRSCLGSNLRTNPNLHSKVYWTPTKMVVTSANASASGLSLQDDEVVGNIEAGLTTNSDILLNETKKWFDRVYALPESVEIDDGVIKKAKAMWSRRRPGRFSPKLSGTLTDVLRNAATLADRRIWVVFYEEESMTAEGKAQHNKLKREWNKKELVAPVVADGEVRFTNVDDYEELSLKGYHWNSWIIDLTDGTPCFWFVPDRRDVRENVGTNTKTVPVFQALRIPFGAEPSITLSRNDIRELQRRWMKKYGAKSDRWVPLEEFSD
jgi:hypothetical protein